MNTALMPNPRIQFADANGKPLAGGQIFTYAAGTSTPQAAYTDSTGATALPNPVVLDAGGFASIWLSSANYKIVAEDVNNVVQWTVDNVSAVSQTELQGTNSFSSLAVSGNTTIGGNLAVSGTITAASETLSGSLAVGGTLSAASAAITGALTAGSAAITGNETIGGTLSVTGATTLSSLNIGAQTLTQFVQALIPALTAVAGTLIISDVSPSGNWIMFTFGSTAGTRIRIAVGAATGVANGASISLPSGFTTSNLYATASIANCSATPGNQISNFSCSVSGGVVSVAASDNSGHSYTPTANWFAIAFLTGY